MPKSDKDIGLSLGKYIKQKSYQCLKLEAGDKVLDIGCGSGIDTVSMASLHPQDCRFYGVDIDEVLLNQADELAKEKGVSDRISHQLADVCELPFEDEFFNCIRVEQLFQFLPSFLQPHEIFKEILRVLKPGGRLVVIDTDWSSASVDFPNIELERRMMLIFSRYLRANGIAGRQLYGLYKHNNLENVLTEVFPVEQYNFADTLFGKDLQNESVKSGLVSNEEADYWHQELSMLDKLGEFYSCVNIIMVSGHKK